MFRMMAKWSTAFYIAAPMMVVPCEGGVVANEFRKHSYATTPEGKGKAPVPLPGSPAYIDAHPPPPLCTSNGISVYIGKDNRRSSLQNNDYKSDERLRNTVRCKGDMPSEKCLAFELRKDKADIDPAPAPALLSRQKNSLRQIMMDAVEGPIPYSPPMESRISGFGQSTNLVVQPPTPVVKPMKPMENHPMIPVVNNPVNKAVAHAAGAHPGIPSHVGGSGNAELNMHMANPCSAVAQKECPCTQDNDLPLLWKPHQTLVDLVEQVSLVVPEQKNRDLKKDPLHMLLLGVGSGSLSMSVLNNCRVFVPGGLKVESVEPNQNAVNVATQFFGFKAIPNVHKVEVASCGAAVEHRVKDAAAYGGKYDVVVIDIFDGDNLVPPTVRNQTFLSQVRSIMKDSGVLLQSVHDKQLAEVVGDYTAVFGLRVRKDHVESHNGPIPYHVIVAGDLDLAKSGAAWTRLMGFTAMLVALVTLVNM